MQSFRKIHGGLTYCQALLGGGSQYNDEGGLNAVKDFYYCRQAESKYAIKHKEYSVVIFPH